MASCGAGAPHRPGGAARLPPFFMPQPGSAGRRSPLPSRGRFSPPFFRQASRRGGQSLRRTARKTIWALPGARQRPRPPRARRPRRRQSEGRPQKRRRTGRRARRRKTKRGPGLRAQKKTRSVGIRHCGSLSAAPAEERLLTHGFRGHTPFGSDAVRKTDRTYVPGRGRRPGGGARDHAPPGDV